MLRSKGYNVKKYKKTTPKTTNVEN